MRDRSEQVVHERGLHLLTSELLLDVDVRDGRRSALEQHVHERAIAQIRRNATG